MSALSSPRNTKEIYCNAAAFHRVLTPAANTTVHPGSICALNSSGKAVPASDTAGLTAVGRCEEMLHDGRVIAKSGVFIFDNGTGSEALSIADLNHTVYVLDDHTVGKAGGTNSIVAGVLRDVISASELAVEIGNQTLS